MIEIIALIVLFVTFIDAVLSIAKRVCEFLKEKRTSAN